MPVQTTRECDHAVVIESHVLVLICKVLRRNLGLFVLREGVPGGSREALWRYGEGPWGRLVLGRRAGT